MQELAGCRILSWSDDGTLRLWDGQTATALAAVKDFVGSVIRQEEIVDGGVLFRLADGTLRLWDGQTCERIATTAPKDFEALRFFDYQDTKLAWTWLLKKYVCCDLFRFTMDLPFLPSGRLVILRWMRGAGEIEASSSSRTATGRRPCPFGKPA